MSVLIGIHAERQRRRKHLIDNLGMDESQAEHLINRDEEEVKTSFGFVNFLDLPRVAFTVCDNGLDLRTALPRFNMVRCCSDTREC